MFVLKILLLLSVPTQAGFFKFCDRIFGGDHPRISEDLSQVPRELYSLLDMDPRMPKGLTWMSSDGMTEIGSRNSRSLLMAMVGDNATRILYWPKKPNSTMPDLSKIRVALNYTPLGKIHSAEVFFKDGEGFWVPQAYVFHNGMWEKVGQIRGRATNELCLVCHRQGDTEQMIPRAYFVETESHFRAVGYTDPLLIEEFLKEH